MRVVVDLALCQGYAQCAFLAPDSFRLSGSEALMYDPNPADELRARVMRAADACPVRAILTDATAQDESPVRNDASVRHGVAGDAR
jgi:ferredoxin